MNLFHGSRTKSANDLINNMEGLDPQFSSDNGLWGRAVYFATKASYSNDYAYRLPNGSRQMLYCKVYIGKCCALHSDKSLRTPPQGYTSVKGNTKNTDVYMVYKNDRSYIDCIITYVKDLN